jgi:hypothetical protein
MDRIPCVAGQSELNMLTWDGSVQFDGAIPVSTKMFSSANLSRNGDVTDLYP